MNSNQPRNLQDHLTSCRTRVEEARQADDPRQLSVALTDLGLAAFSLREFEAGLDAFNEAGALAATLDDPQFQAQIIALRATAYQDIGRYHDAYESVEEIVQLADAHADADMRCTAMITQAKIVIESGEPLMAEERLKAARQLADTLSDQNHLMQIHGVMGNLKIALADLEQAQTHFEMAALVAVQLGNQRAECGYLIHKGTVLVWQKNPAAALTVFERALTLAEALEDPHAELTCLRYMTECLHNSGVPERVPGPAKRGIATARQLRDSDAVFVLFQTLIMAYYRTQQADLAHQALQDAVAYAQSIKNMGKEADMLLNLGESCIVFGLFDQALDAYQRALTVVKGLGRATDEAHITGRIGVVLAELGQTVEAIEHHRRAAELAQARKLPALEGEQLTMLALAYIDQQDYTQARECCQQALGIYASAGLEPQIASVQQLLVQIDASA